MCDHEHLEQRSYFWGLFKLWICKECGRPFRKNPHIRFDDDKFHEDKKTEL